MPANPSTFGDVVDEATPLKGGSKAVGKCKRTYEENEVRKRTRRLGQFHCSQKIQSLPISLPI